MYCAYMVAWLGLKVAPVQICISWSAFGWINTPTDNVLLKVGSGNVTQLYTYMCERYTHNNGVTSKMN